VSAYIVISKFLVILPKPLVAFLRSSSFHVRNQGVKCDGREKLVDPREGAKKSFPHKRNLFLGATCSSKTKDLGYSLTPFPAVKSMELKN
jgi:hypothetical protein